MRMLDPIDRLRSGQARALLKTLREILWPRRNPEEPWSPATLDAIGELIVGLLRPTPSEESMANYYPFARSNYFMVKDAGAFEIFCKKWSVELIRGGDGDKLFGFLCPEAETGIPSCFYDEAKDEYVDGDFIADLATHLADGWVAIVREIGYEKLRYLVGYTIAVNSKGRNLGVDLNEIYRRARKLGKHVTECEW